MDLRRNIIIIGPPAVGKTTLGKLIAPRLGRKFVNSDDEIESQCGQTIREIFKTRGEAGFREIEQRVLLSVLARDGILLATGAGAVLLEENRIAMAKRGLVVCLESSAEQLIKRVVGNNRRPLFQGVDPYKKMQSLLSERAPLYREIANIVLAHNPQGSTPIEAAEKIARIIGRHPSLQSLAPAP